MYLNQFTNTKKFWYVHCARTMTKTFTVGTCLLCVCRRGRYVKERIPSIFFSSTKGHEIYYSILFQPAKWVLQGIIIQKMSQFHKKLFPLPKLYSISTFAELFTGFKYIHPLLSIESHWIQVTRDHKKSKKTNRKNKTNILLYSTYRSNASIWPQSRFSSGCISMKGSSLYIFTTYLHDSFH